VTDQAIVKITEGIRTRLEQAVGNNNVYVGPPVASEVGERLVSLFLFHIVPNREMRNQPRYTQATQPQPPQQPGQLLDALPLDLRYLITVFRRAGAGGLAEPNELLTLGQVVRVLHAQPMLSGAAFQEQLARLSIDPYPMEELSRVWGLFPQDHYRTSIVYLASPVFVEAGADVAGPPVISKEQKGGGFSEPPDISGRRRDQNELEGISG
jgi:hypothetical protein